MGNPVTEEELDRDLRVGGWPTAAQSILLGAVQGWLPYASLSLAHSNHMVVCQVHTSLLPLPSHQDHCTSHEGGFCQRISPNVILSLPVSVWLPGSTEHHICSFFLAGFCLSLLLPLSAQEWLWLRRTQSQTAAVYQRGAPNSGLPVPNRGQPHFPASALQRTGVGDSMTPLYLHQHPSMHTARHHSQGFPTSSQARSQVPSGQVWLNSLRPGPGV